MTQDAQRPPRQTMMSAPASWSCDADRQRSSYDEAPLVLRQFGVCHREIRAHAEMLVHAPQDRSTRSFTPDLAASTIAWSMASFSRSTERISTVLRNNTAYPNF